MKNYCVYCDKHGHRDDQYLELCVLRTAGTDMNTLNYYQNLISGFQLNMFSNLLRHIVRESPVSGNATEMPSSAEATMLTHRKPTDSQN